MTTKEKIIEILQSYSYNVEDQAGNHLIVVDNDSWGAVATEVENCSIPDVVGQSEQLNTFITWLKDNYSIKIHDMVLQDYIRYGG